MPLDAIDTTDLKEAFALNLLLQHNDAMKAARAICSDLGYCLFMASHWPSDLYVLSHKARLLEEHGAAFFLPTKFDIAHKLIETADKANVPDDKIKALKLYSELMGFVEKPGAIQNNITNVTQNRVMVVPAYGSDDDWQKELLANQRKLVQEA